LFVVVVVVLNMQTLGYQGVVLSVFYQPAMLSEFLQSFIFIQLLSGDFQPTRRVYRRWEGEFKIFFNFFCSKG